MDRPHPHAQRLADALGDLLPREWAVQHAKHRVNRFRDNPLGHALPKRPADAFLRTPCAAPNEYCQILGRQQKQRATHARSLDQDPFIESLFDLRDLQSAHPRRQRELRCREKLRLSAGHVADDGAERLCRCTLREMMPREPKGGYLFPG
jgi:hypothetical protein